jgi:DNA-directed RNA polymerase II subunit RPB1
MSLDYSEDVASVTSVHFGVLSPERIRQMSVCEIYRHIGSQTTEGTLMDERLGPIEKGLICPTCKNDCNKCAGHYGHIELATPVIVPQFYQQIIKIANMFCYRCSEFLYPKNKEDGSYTDEYKSIISRRGQSRYNYITKLNQKPFCHACDAIQLKFIKNKDDVLGICKKVTSNNKKSDLSSIQQQQIPVSNFELFNMFKRISDENVELIGFNPKFTRPEWLFWICMPVPPTAMRPSIKDTNDRISYDDLVHKLNDIIKTNNLIRSEMDEQKSGMHSNDKISNLQYHVVTYIDNGISSIKKATHRNGRPIKSIRQRIGKKDGRFRSGLMGKRVNFSGRTVVTPDPNLSLDQLGMPKDIAMDLPYPERVNKLNIGYLTEFIKRGPYVWPGAKSVIKTNANGGSKKIHLSVFKTPEERVERCQLEIGDVVNRHLIDGDWALFNRQPSLHRMSMMGHRIKVHNEKSFQFNQNAAKPYGADFDGDEMNVHIPISCESVAEVRFLMSVPTQIITPQKHGPIMGFVQDSVLGSFKLSKEGTNLNLFQTMRLLSSIRTFQNDLPEPNEIINGIPFWTNQQIYSLVLPNICYLNYIKGGKVLNGMVLNDKIVGNKKHQTLFHTVWNDKGPLATRDLMDNMSSISNEWLRIKGFSCGVSDCECPNISYVHRTIDQYLQLSKELIASIKMGKSMTPDIFEQLARKYIPEEDLLKNNVKNNKDLESDEISRLRSIGDLSIHNAIHELPKKLMVIADACRSKIQVFITSNTPSTNRISTMIQSGSKGKKDNLSLAVGLIGLNAVDGEWIRDFYYRRPTPHTPKDTLDLCHRGFAKNSFQSGLTAQEYYYDAVSGRDGVISKGIKTAETGYIQRKFIKALEGISSCFDGTIRNENGVIVDNIYGNDGFDATFHEKQEIPFLTMNLEKLQLNYRFQYLNEELKTILTEDVYKSLDMNEVNRSLDQEFDKIHEYYSYIKKNIYNGKIPKEVYCPVNFNRLVETVAFQFNLIKVNGYGSNIKYEGGKCDLDPVTILNGINNLRNRIVVDEHSVYEKEGINYNATILFNSLLAINLNSKNLLMKYHYNKIAFTFLLETIYEKFLRALLNPKENIGVVSAQALGEPVTQMALSAFHEIGTGKEAITTTGVPRLKEIIGTSKNPKIPTMLIQINSTYLSKLEDKKAEFELNFKEVEKFASNIIFTDIKQVVTSSMITYDADGTVCPEDQELINNYWGINSKTIKYPLEGQWIVRFEFNRELMAEKFISMVEVYNVVANILDYENLTEGKDSLIFVSDDNDKKLITRISISHDTQFDSDPIGRLRYIQQRILNGKIKGIDGINGSIVKPFNKDIVLDNGEVVIFTPETSDQYKKYTEKYSHMSFNILTTGANLIEIMNLPEVDTFNTISNNVWDMYCYYGIEAARNCLVFELQSIMEREDVIQRHAELLIAVMTSQGILISIDRYGQSKGDAGTFARMSFEEPIQQCTKSVLFNEVDPMTGVSANIMFGQLSKTGTNGSTLGLDLLKLKTLTPSNIQLPDRFNRTKSVNINETRKLTLDPCNDDNFDFDFKF